MQFLSVLGYVAEVTGYTRGVVTVLLSCYNTCFINSQQPGENLTVQPGGGVACMVETWSLSQINICKRPCETASNLLSVSFYSLKSTKFWSLVNFCFGLFLSQEETDF